MAKTKAAAEGKIKVRILVDCDLGKCNEVVEVDADQVSSLAGLVDSDPAAVEYAESVAN